MNRTNVDFGEIKRLCALFPEKLAVSVIRSKDGGFVAEVVDYPGVITEGDTLSELIYMINDVMRLVFDIPERYAEYVPTYLPPIKLAHDLEILPLARKHDLTLLIGAGHKG